MAHETSPAANHWAGIRLDNHPASAPGSAFVSGNAVGCLARDGGRDGLLGEAAGPKTGQPLQAASWHAGRGGVAEVPPYWFAGNARLCPRDGLIRHPGLPYL